jgi:class 3 adenylate cyclase
MLLYLGPGILLSGLAKVDREARGTLEEAAARALPPAWWGAGWTLPMMAMGLDTGHRGSPLFFFIGLALYIGAGTFLNFLYRSEPEADTQPEPSGDPQVSRATLLRMLFELQHALEAQKQHRSFLSIDVVDSSGMKLEASDLAVEHSFGQLHRWLGEVVRACGGELHSAAGDGMMCLFGDEAQAVRAARRIQEGIAGFNAEQNRLPQPFRLRCGVSAGDVAIEPGVPLGAVQSAVIDRAAALQRRAEPGGVVVGSETLAAGQAELGSLVVLPDPVAGGPAFSWRAS